MPISIPHCLSNFTLAPSVIQLILCFNPGLCRVSIGYQLDYPAAHDSPVGKLHFSKLGCSRIG